MSYIDIKYWPYEKHTSKYKYTVHQRHAMRGSGGWAAAASRLLAWCHHINIRPCTFRSPRLITLCDSINTEQPGLVPEHLAGTGAERVVTTGRVSRRQIASATKHTLLVSPVFVVPWHLSDIALPEGTVARRYQTDIHQRLADWQRKLAAVSVSRFLNA